MERRELTIEKDLDEAKKVFEDIEALGISIAKVTQELEDEGVEAFKQAYHSCKQEESRANQSRSQLGDLTSQVEEQVRHLKENKFVERMFAKDPTLWTQDQSAQDEVRNRLGWLDVSIDKNKEIIKEANQLLQELKAERFTHALLLGMGGSSLAAEVYRGLLDGENIEGLDLTILDSTNPNQVQEALKRSDVNKTLYIVSSKSGGTAEVKPF
jgi:transaldolase/glucose-6-phosphate isomerase